MPNDSTRPEPAKSLQDAIDENLRRLYQDILKEGTPERFQVLLDQLQQARAARKP